MLTYTMDVEKRSTWLRTTPALTQRNQPFLCTEAGAFYARQHFATERSNKESFIIFYTLSGAGMIRQESQRLTLGKGQALLMDCRNPQSYGTSPECHHWYHLWAHVDGTGVAALGELLGLPTLAPVEMPPAPVRQCFDVLFENLTSEGRIPFVRTGLAVHELLASMALAVDSPAQMHEQSTVDLAREYIEKNHTRELSVAEIADKAAMSTSQLIRLFRRQLGTTPHNYLLRYRITHAKELLAETSLPVEVISREVGFASASNFSYRFSEMVGQSPSAYRAATPRLVG